MSIQEHAIPYRDGHVVVREHPGEGPDVVLVHGPGFCAAAWDLVVETLGGAVHAYAIDLPGHGGSTASMRRPDDAWESVIEAVRHLDLPCPLLVGMGHGSQACVAASLEAGGLFAGIVALGGAYVRTTENALSEIEFYTSAQFRAQMRDRFFFGYRGRTDAEARTLIDHVVARLATDWRVVGFKGLREETAYSLRPHPDGDGWVNVPTPETITTMLSIPATHRYFPDERLLPRVDIPVEIVQLSNGLDAEHAGRERALAAQHEFITARALDAGDYPHYTRHKEVAAIVLEACGRMPRPSDPDEATDEGIDEGTTTD